MQYFSRVASFFFFFLFKLRTNIKINIRQFFNMDYLHALTKLDMPEGIGLPDVSGRVRDLTAESFIFACKIIFKK